MIVLAILSAIALICCGAWLSHLMRATPQRPSAVVIVLAERRLDIRS